MIKNQLLFFLLQQRAVGQIGTRLQRFKEEYIFLHTDNACQRIFGDIPNLGIVVMPQHVEMVFSAHLIGSTAKVYIPEIAVGNHLCIAVGTAFGFNYNLPSIYRSGSAFGCFSLPSSEFLAVYVG